MSDTSVVDKGIDFDIEEAYITIPQGFRANAISVDLKDTNPDPNTPIDYYDFSLIESTLPCTVAGVYTSNVVKGGSLLRDIELISKGGPFRAIAVNSKIANACVTGGVAVSDAEEIASAVASSLNCDSSMVLTASTGVIGKRLPVSKMVSSVPSLVEGLSSDKSKAHLAEIGMMTTDTVPKEVACKITLSNGTVVSIAGMAKGSGMICPTLATMIGLFTTDASISKELLDKALKTAVAHTFNRVCVDGDTSVCDSVMIMANGASGHVIDESYEDYAIFTTALTALSEDLARMLAADGEGATKFVEVEVYGAKDQYEAKLIVSSVAKSPLCKTAFFGMDANFGRILTAIGYSGASFDPNKVDVFLSGLPVCKDGCALPFDEEEALSLLKERDIRVKIVLKEGEAYDRMFTCDYSYDYVRINGSYRT